MISGGKTNRADSRRAVLLIQLELADPGETPTEQSESNVRSEVRT